VGANSDSVSIANQASESCHVIALFCFPWMQLPVCTKKSLLHVCDCSGPVSEQFLQFLFQQLGRLSESKAECDTSEEACTFCMYRVSEKRRNKLSEGAQRGRTHAGSWQ
jgi:hypothetical protein